MILKEEFPRIFHNKKLTNRRYEKSIQICRQNGRKYLGDAGQEGRIILKEVLKK
jgi:hypothetical protein